MTNIKSYVFLQSLNLIYFQSLNISLMKIMPGFVDVGNKEHLLHLLDVAKRAAQSDTTKLDDDQDEAISNNDSKIDEEKIHLNASEIKDIYVRLSSLLYHHINVQTCQSVHLYNHLFIHLFIGTITSSNFS